jgi:hypothetical protein
VESKTTEITEAENETMVTRACVWREREDDNQKLQSLKEEE